MQGGKVPPNSQRTLPLNRRILCQLFMLRESTMPVVLHSMHSDISSSTATDFVSPACSCTVLLEPSFGAILATSLLGSYYPQDGSRAHV